MFLSEERLEELWPDEPHQETILHAVSPILRGLGDIAEVHVERVADGLSLVVGDLGLARFEAKLSEAWSRCVDRDESAFRIVSSLYRVIYAAATKCGADCVLVDVGPNLGALNRSAIIAASHIAVPIAADLYSLQGLKNLGPSLLEWREQWCERLQKRPDDRQLTLPDGSMTPAGYIVLQHAVRLDRPVKAYERWMARIPETYHAELLKAAPPRSPDPNEDPECLASLKHYRSLMPLAQDAHKPMFHLRSADGALGSHLRAVEECRRDFHRLAARLAERCGIHLPRAV